MFLFMALEIYVGFFNIISFVWDAETPHCIKNIENQDSLLYIRMSVHAAC